MVLYARSRSTSTARIDREIDLTFLQTDEVASVCDQGGQECWRTVVCRLQPDCMLYVETGSFGVLPCVSLAFPLGFRSVFALCYISKYSGKKGQKNKSFFKNFLQ